MQGLLQGLAFVGLVAALLFGTAGSWQLPFVWAYVGLNAGLVIAGAIVIDPDLQRERLRPGPGGTDLLPMLLIGLPSYVGQLVVAGFDVGRFHWSGLLPSTLKIAALCICAASWTVVLWAMAVNRFFSSVVRIQRERGHRLVTIGPYCYVRHPGYLGAILGFLSGPLALGSWWALVAGQPIILLILRRTTLEDGFLNTELEGYAEYARRVRYRLVPGIW